MSYKEDFKKYSGEISSFFSNKKVQNILVILLLAFILFMGTSIRCQNISLLKDSSSGEYIPLDLDSFYFLRIAETLDKGPLPAIDPFRYPALQPGWSNEVLPKAILGIHKVGQLFYSDMTIRFADIISPIVFFILGIIIFFLLSWKLSKSKGVALAASGLLVIIPTYLYRTLLGSSDHDSIGMFGFFLSLLLFSLGALSLNKGKVKILPSALWGLVAGIGTMFAIASWGGGGRFLFMILPLAFLIMWFVKEEKSRKNYLSFYGTWLIVSLISAPLFGFGILNVMKGYILNSAGILTLFTFGYVLIDSILSKYKLIGKKFSHFNELINLVIVIILGGILYQIFVGHFFALLGDLIGKILYPFGTERVGLTVAENKQPYLNDWIDQMGKFIFYVFLAGCFIVGAKLANGIKEKKLKPLFTLSFAFFVIGILFSRISATAVLNGDSFLSRALFFISFLIFAISSIYVYKKSEWSIDTKWILIAAWMIPMLLSVRSAIRVFFTIIPFVTFIIPLTILEIGKFVKKSKDDLMKLIAIIILVVIIVGTVITAVSFYKSTNAQAKYTSPPANLQWQNAMGWVRDNTAVGSVFVHWWDYGYWVQTLGERPTLTDGGHVNIYWDHLIGRYLLTTPYPETAKSYMKSQNVSYLLIDPSDIGKYTAYSSIGSDDSGNDRTSWLQMMISNPANTQETRDGQIKIYQGGIALDEDLYYESPTGEEIFLPQEQSGIIGAILEFYNDGKLKQPEGVYVVNGKQIRIPVRYIYFNGELFDFKVGIEATLYLYPYVTQSPAGPKIDQTGAIMYLSEKVKDSLVAKLYLMDDPNNEYSELNLVYDNNGQGFYYYGGFVGPIKIWEVGEMNNIVTHDEFLREDGGYAEFDNLVFVK